MKFIIDKPAMVTDSSLVIGDLHLGMEFDLYKAGVAMPSLTEKIRDKVLDLAGESGAKELVILGDVKHNIPQISLSERKEVPDFFKHIRKHFDRVEISPGNHDGNLKKLLPEGVELHETKGFLKGDDYFLHGHTWPKKEVKNSKNIITSHSHPAVEFRDHLGYRSVELCWVRGGINKNQFQRKFNSSSTKNFVILPPFNPLIGGMPLNREKEKVISPLYNVFNIEEAHLYLLDGTDLGKLKQMKRFRR